MPHPEYLQNLQETTRKGLEQREWIKSQHLSTINERVDTEIQRINKDIGDPNSEIARRIRKRASKGKRECKIRGRLSTQGIDRTLKDEMKRIFQEKASLEIMESHLKIGFHLSVPVKYKKTLRWYHLALIFGTIPLILPPFPLWILCDRYSDIGYNIVLRW